MADQPKRDRVADVPDEGIPAFETVAPATHEDALRTVEAIEALPQEIAEKVARAAGTATPSSPTGPGNSPAGGPPASPGGASDYLPDPPRVPSSGQAGGAAWSPSDDADLVGSGSKLLGALGQLPGMGVLGQIAGAINTAKSIADAVQEFQDHLDMLGGIAVTPRQQEREYQQNLAKAEADPAHKQALADAEAAIARTKRENAERNARSTSESAEDFMERMRNLQPNIPQELPENAAFDIPGIPHSGAPSLSASVAEQDRMDAWLAGLPQAYGGAASSTVEDYLPPSPTMPAPDAESDNLRAALEIEKKRALGMIEEPHALPPNVELPAPQQYEFQGHVGTREEIDRHMAFPAFDTGTAGQPFLPTPSAIPAAAPGETGVPAFPVSAAGTPATSLQGSYLPELPGPGMPSNVAEILPPAPAIPNVPAGSQVLPEAPAIATQGEPNDNWLERMAQAANRFGDAIKDNAGLETAGELPKSMHVGKSMTRDEGEALPKTWREQADDVVTDLAALAASHGPRSGRADGEDSYRVPGFSPLREVLPPHVGPEPLSGDEAGLGMPVGMPAGRGADMQEAAEAMMDVVQEFKAAVADFKSASKDGRSGRERREPMEPKGTPEGSSSQRIMREAAKAGDDQDKNIDFARQLGNVLKIAEVLA